MQFVAYETAAILQNIAKQRGEKGESFYQKDLWNAASLAYLSIFPGNTMAGIMEPSACFPLGYFAHTTLMYVIGTGTDEAQGKWAFYVCGGGNNPNIAADNNYLASCSTLSFNAEPSPAQSFFSVLKISKGEAKLLVQCTLFYRVGDRNDGFTDGRKCKDVSPRQVFNFLMLIPKGTGRGGNGFFTSTAIFTPRGNTFTEKLPPQELGTELDCTACFW